MNEEKSVFETLSAVNVEKFVNEKNGFRYLSWANALNELLKHYPTSTWEVREWDGVPYLLTGAGCFVEVTVIIHGISRKQLHPILDFRNQPIMKPNAFQVNASIQRALAKAISLHGLGLYIYQGEDLPPSEKEALANMRQELKSLLSTHGLLNKDSANAIHNMNETQLNNKIEEYRKKEVK